MHFCQCCATYFFFLSCVRMPLVAFSLNCLRARIRCHSGAAIIGCHCLRMLRLLLSTINKLFTHWHKHRAAHISKLHFISRIASLYGRTIHRWGEELRALHSTTSTYSMQLAATAGSTNDIPVTQSETTKRSLRVAERRERSSSNGEWRKNEIECATMPRIPYACSCEWPNIQWAQFGGDITNCSGFLVKILLQSERNMCSFFFLWRCFTVEYLRNHSLFSAVVADGRYGLIARTTRML